MRDIHSRSVRCSYRLSGKSSQRKSEHDLPISRKIIIPRYATGSHVSTGLRPSALVAGLSYSPQRKKRSPSAVPPLWPYLSPVMLLVELIIPTNVTWLLRLLHLVVKRRKYRPFNPFAALCVDGMCYICKHSGTTVHLGRRC